MIVIAFVFMMTTALLLQHLIRQKPSREDFPEIIVTSMEQQDGETS
jgi:hypothetical protein